MKKKLILYFIIFFCGVFLFSANMAIQIICQSNKEKEAFNELASTIASQSHQDKSTDEGNTMQAEPVQSEVVSPYKLLKEQNEDFFGWISIEGTTIDYPVMYTPDAPEYYLRRAFDKTSSQSGVPFLDARCFDDCGNYLIYGHNMNNGTMFAELLSYAQKDFWQQHPVIQLDTLTNPGSYLVIAAFYSKVYAEGETGFCYYQYTDLSDSNDFLEYIEQAEKFALYDTGVTAEYGDQILTLSTCCYHTANGRFVVVARKSTD